MEDSISFMSTHSTEKWSCDVCTYDNYHSSLKCVMCRTSKQQSSQTLNIYDLENPLPTSEGTIDSDELMGNNSTGIFNQNHNSGLNVNGRIDRTENENLETCKLAKWLCAACTFYNWPSSLKCTVCGTIGPYETLPSPQYSRCVSPTVISEHIDSPEEDMAANNSTDAKINTLKCSSTQNCIDDINNNYEEIWLAACLGVVEDDWSPIDTYIQLGGDLCRSLTHSEVLLLNRPLEFEAGHTLIHLAVKLDQKEILANLLIEINTRSNSSLTKVKRLPSHVGYELVNEIGKHFHSTISVEKSLMPCPFVTEFVTFTLPYEIGELPDPVQQQLLNALLDNNVQRQLEIEEDPPVINWTSEIGDGLCSRLYALWNRSAGDCLLDSLMQSTWGIFDTDNILRKALADCLRDCKNLFYPRWKEYEEWQAKQLEFCLDEYQWAEDWDTLVSQAVRPGSSLAQLHIFALAHVLRRPIIVYAIKYVKNYRGDCLDYTNFEGLYLPLLWEKNFCIKSPITLAFTQGHFSSLVPVEPTLDGNNKTYLPIVDKDLRLFPIHFIIKSEMGREDDILNQRLDIYSTNDGLLMAKQILPERPLLVAQMLEEWLNYYRKQALSTSTQYSQLISIQDYSSDEDSEQK